MSSLEAEKEATLDRTIPVSALFVITLILAGCSLVYELLIAHTIAQLAANAVIWYSVTIGLFLCGMGVGSLIFQRYLRRISGLHVFYFIEIGLAFIGILAVPIILASHSIYSLLHFWQYQTGAPAVFFFPCFGLTIVIGILTGIELPLLMRLAKDHGSMKNSAHKVLGFDYIGSLLGSLVFALVLVPQFSSLAIGLFVASVNLLVVVLFLGASHALQARQFHRCLPILAAGVIVVSFLTHTDAIEQFFLKRYYCYRLLSQSVETFLSLGKQFPRVQRIRSRYQMIDLVHDLEGDGSDAFVDVISKKFIHDPSFPRNRLLFLNRDWQFHSNHEEIYHEYFAHVPIMQTGRVPSSILLLGGGDGLLLRELLRYQSVKKIVHVDLDPVLIEFSKTNPILRYMNKDSLNDPKVVTVYADAFQYIRDHAARFDAIYIDLPTPNDYNIAKLYSSEFYSHVRARLNPQGFMVFDAVGISAFHLPDADGVEHMKTMNPWQRYHSTLQAAGFTRIVPYVSFFGWKQPRAVAAAAKIFSTEEAERRVQSYVRQRRNGFIMVGMPGMLFGHPFKAPPGGPLYVLNKERYELAFHYSFPTEVGVAPSTVNSIFRPTFPVVPLWTAKLPF